MVKTRFVSSGTSLFRLEMSYDNSMLNFGDRTVDDMVTVFERTKSRILELCDKFKNAVEGMYPFVRFYEKQDKDGNSSCSVRCRIHVVGSMTVWATGELHAPFNREVIREACDAMDIDFDMEERQ